SPGTVRRTTLSLGLFAGMLIPGLAYGACLFLAGADFPAWIQHHLVRLNSLELANSDLPGFWGLLQSDEPQDYLFGMVLIFMGLLLAVSAGLAFRLWKKTCPNDRARALMLGVLLVAGILLLNQVRLGLKFIRLSQVSPALYILFAFLLCRTWQCLKTKSSPVAIRWLPPAAALVFFLGLAGYIWAFEGTWSQDSFAVYKVRPYFMNVPKGRCYFKGKKGEEIEEVVRFLQEKTAPGEPIFTGPTCPLFHFLADRPDPAPFTDFTFYYFNEANQKAMIEAIERAGVNYGVQWPRPLTGFYFETCAPLLASYFNTHFHQERMIGRFVIFRRN
ncbi:MAG: hypothetical protein KJ645_08960, partial [Planctomycetes bacterium]|nr:hypothetical protein [Planctomycetota bacterium]